MCKMKIEVLNKGKFSNEIIPESPTFDSIIIQAYKFEIFECSLMRRLVLHSATIDPLGCSILEKEEENGSIRIIENEFFQ